MGKLGLDKAKQGSGRAEEGKVKQRRAAYTWLVGFAWLDCHQGWGIDLTQNEAESRLRGNPAT